MKVEDLVRAREEAANVAYMSFNAHIRQNKDGLFCFFEGKDSPYYITKIRHYYTGSYFPFGCKGKAKVVKVYELINYHREYDKYKTAFFVDRDFDPPISNPDIYETPCYAIENFYTDKAVFAEILKSEIGLTEVNESFTKSMAVYEARQAEFHECMTLFNAWYACLMDKKHAIKQETGATLEEKPPKDFISISLEEIKCKYDIAKIKITFSKALEIEEEELTAKIALFNTLDKGCVFRGKFELSFMCDIIDFLVADSKSTKVFINKPIKFNLDRPNTISRFSQYAITPDCLVAYIKQVVST